MRRWQRVRWWLIWGVGMFLLGCEAVSENGRATAVAPIPPLPRLDATEVALGEQVYAHYCASCHGVNLEGQANWKEQNEDESFRAPPHDVSGHTWHHADDVLRESVELGGVRFAGVDIGGISNMPAFGGILTEEEITAVLTYIKSTWPDETRRRQWEMTVMVERQK